MQELPKKIYLSRDHGRDVEGNVIAWGTNCRLDNLQAAFLKYRLSKFDEDVKGWVSFFSYKPENMFSLEGTFYSTINKTDQ